MLEQRLPELESAALARIQAASTPNDLEQVRIDVLGRKGSLNQISRDMGKLPQEERARCGKQLNAAKQNIESAFEARAQQFAGAKLAGRLNAEWLDLTLPS